MFGQNIRFSDAVFEIRTSRIVWSTNNMTAMSGFRVCLLFFSLYRSVRQYREVSNGDSV
jgi:hypothetical protein